MKKSFYLPIIISIYFLISCSNPTTSGDSNDSTSTNEDKSYFVDTYAGSGTAGFLDSSAFLSSFNEPCGLAVDGEGNVYIADSLNNVIRRIAISGVVTTFAGSGNAGFQDGIGTNAEFNEPQDIGIDDDGNLYVADFWNHAIRKITPAGVVSTLAGTGDPGDLDWNGDFNGPWGLDVSPGGNIFVADTWNNKIKMVSPDGTVATIAGSGVEGFLNGSVTNAEFSGPKDVAYLSGYIYVSDFMNNVIRKIDLLNGTVETYAGNGNNGYLNDRGIYAEFYRPWGITADPLGNIYVADWGNSSIRMINTDSYVTTFAGCNQQGSTDGSAGQASFLFPENLVIDINNSVMYISDTKNNIIRSLE